MALNKYKLGDLIELTCSINADNKYGPDDVVGITIYKEVIPTKADVSNTDLSKFLIVKPNEFIYNPRTHGKRIGLGFNDKNKNVIISWNNSAFKIKDEAEKIILPRYLFMFFNRTEWDRKACVNSWGSSTEVFTWEEMCYIDIELPSIDIQQKYVDIYMAMVENQKSYEKGLDDLKLVCDSTIESFKNIYPIHPIGDYVHSFDERNHENTCQNIKGATVYKKLIDTKADMTDVSLLNYKLLHKNDIVYVPTTNRNGDKIACGIALDETIVSQIYETIRVNDENILNPKYLFLWFKRHQMDRYARYMSWGSARENIIEEDLFSYKIPVPSIMQQNYVVDILSALDERTKINDLLKDKIKKISPVLIKGSLEEAMEEA